jgi:hypothetical protein
MLAAVGAHVMLRGGRRSVNATAAGLLVAGVTIVAVLFFHDHLAKFREAWSKLPPELVWKHASVRMLVQWILGLACAATVVVIVIRQWTNRGVGIVWRLALVAVVSAEMLWSAWDSNVLAPLAIADPPAPQSVQQITAAAGEGRVIAALYLLPANLCMRYGFRDVRGYDLPMARRVSAAMKQGGVRLFEKIVEQEGRGIEPQQVYPEMAQDLSTFLNRMGTRYLINCVQYVGRPAEVVPVRSMSGPDKPWKKLPGMGPAGEIVYENPNAYPRVYLAKSAVRGNERDALEALGRPFVNLMEKSVVEDFSWTNEAAIGGSEASLLHIVRDGAERVEIEVESEKGGLLVLGDNMAPGWGVEIDGQPARAVTANYLFRGVMVPGGFHRVRWTYAAPGLRSGAIISAMTLLALLGAVVKRPRGPRR